MNQVWSEEEDIGREIVKTEASWLLERYAAQQNKNQPEELKQGLPYHRD